LVVRHLTDDEIQAYLDLRAEGLAPDLMDHLETCGTCRAAVRAYQALYARLADDRGFEAPPGFAANVIARLNL
jgi:predicted anti-sigma-YlaC factor YlaD